MATECYQHCPNLLSCNSSISAATALYDSSKNIVENFDAALSHLNQAEIADGFAILGGEITAEDSERMRKEMDANPNIAKFDDDVAQQAKTKLAQDEARMIEMVGLSSDALTATEVCNGIRLGMVQRLLHWRVERSQKKFGQWGPDAQESAKPTIELDLRQRQLKHGKCTSPTVKKISKRLAAIVKNAS